MGVTPLEAARVGDEIGHTRAMQGLLVGLAIGAAIVIGGILFAGATVATGGAAAVLIGGAIATVAGTGLTGMKIGSTMDAGPSGPIMTGSPNTFLGSAAIPAARATIDTVACTQHNIKLIAEGSINVFINQYPASRKTDKTVCDGPIREGQPDVFFGGEKGTYLDIEGEVPGWLVTTLEWAALIGSVIAGIGAIFVVGAGAAIGSFIGGYIGGELGTKWGGDIGEALGGATGRVYGEIIGEWIGSTIGGKVGEFAGIKIESRLPPSLLAKMPGPTALNTLAKLPAADLAKLNGPTAAQALASKVPPADLAKLEGPAAVEALTKLPPKDLAKLEGPSATKALEAIKNNPDAYKPGDNPRFWTGGERAQQAARESGGTTMEDTPGGQAMEGWAKQGNVGWPDSEPHWIDSSKNYASEVGKQYGTMDPETGLPISGANSGEPVYVYVSDSARPNGVYFAHEKPILEAYGVNIIEVRIP